MKRDGYKMPKTIYLVRHGESIHNTMPVFQSPDTPLSERGEKQAEAIAERFTHTKFDVLIASPWPRAKQTAEYISKANNQPIVFSDLFVERIKPKAIDGKPFTDEAASRTWRQWEASLYLPNTKVRDGESYDEITNRASRALKFLEERPENIIVVVTHGFFLRVMLSLVLLGDNLNGKLAERFQTHMPTSNTGITVIKYEAAFEAGKSWRLYSFNDRAHWLE